MSHVQQQGIIGYAIKKTEGDQSSSAGRRRAWCVHLGSPGSSAGRRMPGDRGISGTSSGAINAAALAYGVTIDGRDGARRVLADLWGRIGTNVPNRPGTTARSMERSLTLEGAV